MPFQRARAALYDAAIVGMTRDWYRAVLQRLPVGTRVLDVGIGTGSALMANADLVIRRDLHIVGIDVDPAYVARCRTRLARLDLLDHIAVRLESVYEHRAVAYDAVYFSGSFMLLPDPVAALRHVSSLLTPTGRLWFTQTIEHGRSPVLERVKPLLRRLTTIDFGRVTYEPAFRAVLDAAGAALEDFHVLRPGSRRSAVLAVAHPTAARAGAPS